MSPEAKDLIRKMLQPDPVNRPNAAQVNIKLRLGLQINEAGTQCVLC
jgi:serine/threonine protein kinase